MLVQQNKTSIKTRRRHETYLVFGPAGAGTFAARGRMVDPRLAAKKFEAAGGEFVEDQHAANVTTSNGP